MEYPEGHVSKSIYVSFSLNTVTESLKGYEDARVAVWTTTPWTMPANLAVAVNPDLEYSIVNSEKTGKIIVAADLINSLATKFECDFEHLITVKGEEIVGEK